MFKLAKPIAALLGLLTISWSGQVIGGTPCGALYSLTSESASPLFSQSDTAHLTLKLDLEKLDKNQRLNPQVGSTPTLPGTLDRKSVV